MSTRAYRFGDWLVEPELNRISSDSGEKHLEPLAMDVLCYLIEHIGETVSPETLLETVWNGRVVEPNAVPRAVNHIRNALEDDSRVPRYIETIRRRGYRAVAPARKLDSAATASHSSPWVMRTVAASCLLALVLVSVFLIFGADRETEGLTHYARNACAELELAVLPMQNLTGDAAEDYMTKAISSEIWSRLHGYQAIRLVPTRSSFGFLGNEASLAQVREELDSRFIVDGSFNRSGDSLKLLVQLIDSDANQSLVTPLR